MEKHGKAWKDMGRDMQRQGKTWNKIEILSKSGGEPLDLLEEAPAISTQSYGKPIESDRTPDDFHRSPVAVLEAPINVYRSDLETYRNAIDSHRALKKA